MEPIVRIENLHYSYDADRENPIKALQGIDLEIYEGEYLVILGHNGSGKSTLAKHLNALLLPTEGDVWVRNWNSKEHRHARDIRSTVGMVFQTPDNQIVATIVEEDIAFGPENLGLPHADIVNRVDNSLQLVDMLPFRHRAPHLLSGGQKQRICIAGMLAMRPNILVLDESTAMLDPVGRQEVLDIAYRLNKEEGVTIVAITHYMEEAVRADRLVVMAAGKIVMQGPPRQIFQQGERLRELHMDVPQVRQLAQALHRQVNSFPEDLLTVDEFLEAFQQRVTASANGRSPTPNPIAKETTDSEAVITIDNITYHYMYDTPLQVKAIADVSLDIRRGEILGIIGHTGSGKSTIIQHLNALLKPHVGKVTIFGIDSKDPSVDVREIRRRVGLVFQAPEAQLFEHYVGDDVAFGPRNLKLSRQEVRARVRRAMESVGLGFEEFKDRITFSLSGGQMRRAALAGVLALEPEVLVLDEPTAGLDPQGRDQLLTHIMHLKDAQNITLVLVSHNMEELARVCDRICVISDGQVVAIDTTAAIFSNPQMLRDLNLDVPPVTDLVDRLVQVGIQPAQTTILNVDEATAVLSSLLQESMPHE